MIDSKITDRCCWQWLMQNWASHYRSSAPFSDHPQVFDSWSSTCKKMSDYFMGDWILCLGPWKREIRISIIPMGISSIMFHRVSHQQSFHFLFHSLTDFQLIFSSNFIPVGELECLPQFAESQNLTFIQSKKYSRGLPLAARHGGLCLTDGSCPREWADGCALCHWSSRPHSCSYRLG